ncbi:MAG: hypothetical protein V4692_05510, partial [Bdellovibrionota bacterium]
DLTTSRLADIPGIQCVTPQAAFYAMPQVTLPPGETDESFVLGNDFFNFSFWLSGGCDGAAK